MRTFSTAAVRGRNDLFIVGCAGVLWGTGGLLGELLGTRAALSPVAVAAYRLFFGGLLVLGLLVVTRHPVPRTAAAWRRIALVAMLSAGYQAGYFAAVALSSVSLATLITIGISPLLVLAAELVTGRRLDLRTSLSVVLALAGLLLLLGLPGAGLSLHAVLASAALATVAAAGFAAITLLCARPVAGLDDRAVTGYGFVLGGALLIPAAMFSGGMSFRPEPASVALVLALAIVPTALAYTLYFRALRGINTTTAAIMVLVEPLTSALLGAVVLGDRLGAAGLCGAALLCLAVTLVPRRH